MSTLQIKFWGTRGSVPVAGQSHSRFGGNTTCLEVGSDCLPLGHRLLIDAGTGIVPLGHEILSTAGQLKTVNVLFTHYHHDHTQGLLMMPQLYDKSVEFRLFGPEENGVGPKEVFQMLMRPPLFPVSFAEIASRVKCKSVEHPADKVIVSHRSKEPTLITLEELERAEKEPGRQLHLGQQRFDLGECLIIKMHRSNHPERTISYRFEDRASGRVFVFMTDHENTDGIPSSLKKHLLGADVLVMDAQYTRDQYLNYTAGFGHGTPDYCYRVAEAVGAKELYLTHHDPGRNDDAIVDMSGGVNTVADGDIVSL